MNGTNRAVMAIALLVLTVGPAAASTFCGCNGTIKLSFSEGPTIEPVARMSPGDGGLVVVDVWAILDDVAPMEGPGGVFMALGGYEFELQITGGEPFAVVKTLTAPNRGFGQRPTQVWAGTSYDGMRVDRGPIALCHWTVLFRGEVSNVRFALDPAGLLSCEGMATCDGNGVQALYCGSSDARLEDHLFGAGCQPAVLNPTDDADFEPVPCTLGFAEVGVFTPRALR